MQQLFFQEENVSACLDQLVGWIYPF